MVICFFPLSLDLQKLFLLPSSVFCSNCYFHNTFVNYHFLPFLGNSPLVPTLSDVKVSKLQLLHLLLPLPDV